MTTKTDSAISEACAKFELRAKTRNLGNGRLSVSFVPAIFLQANPALIELRASSGASGALRDFLRLKFASVKCRGGAPDHVHFILA